MSRRWPAAAAILKKVNFTNPQIAAAAAMVDVEGMTPEDAAKKWIAENEATWKAWLQLTVMIATHGPGAANRRVRSSHLSCLQA